VIKKDTRRENYSKEKLERGLEKACQKLPIPKDTVQSIIEQIEKWLLELDMPEIHSTEIGKKVMTYLKGVNPVAYVRFASVYKRFEDIDEFYHDLKQNEKLGGRHLRAPSDVNNISK
jgi:transcriptional repressor NrdR